MSHFVRHPAVRSFALIACVTLLPAIAQAQNPCGDCNGDMMVNIVDAFTAAQHAVEITTLTAGDFQTCNVAGDPGPPAAPGMPTVNVLDAVLIAQFSAGLVPSVSCTMLPIVSPGPYDVRFGAVPTDVASNQPFELTITLFDQGTPQPVIPQDPLEVTLSVQTGTGTLLGSVRQFMTSDTQTFANLQYGPLEVFTLRASAGPPNGDDVSGPINCEVAVVADVEGSVVTSAPFPPVRFNFLGDGELTPVSGTFDWEIEDAATMTSVATGSIPLSMSRFANVPVASLPGNGLYRVRGQIRGTNSQDVHALYRGTSVGESNRPTLSSGRIDIPYSVNIMDYVNMAQGAPGYTPMTFGPYTSFAVLPEDLPPGLSLGAGGMGAITGTPTAQGFYEFTAFGVDAAGDVTRFVCHLAIFSFKDAEVEYGIDLQGMGRYMVSEFDWNYSFTNSWDCSTDSTTTRFYYPSNIADLPRLPCITFIHGNGFRYNFYNDLFRSIASYGYIVGSVDNPGYPQQGCTFCSTGGSGGPGYSRAVGFQDSVIEKFQQMDSGALPGGAPGGATNLFEKFDFDNLFYSGHSRGGSTTLCNLQWKPWVCRGAVPSMQVDPRQQGCLGLSFTYPIRPMMSFFAEDDGDVIYPLAENVMEEANNQLQSTSITLYGACHGHFADTAAGGCAGVTPTATRARVKQICRNFFTAFVERHARGDLRLEGQLYIDEWQGDDEVGVYGERDMNGAVNVDDHQTTGATTNLLAGPNSSMTLVVNETNTMPNSFVYSRTIVHRRFRFTSGAGTNTWSAPPGSPVDASNLTWFAFRGHQYNCTSSACLGSVHWDWLNRWDVTLVDATGQRATIDMTPQFPPSTPLSFHQRWTRYAFKLCDFEAANPMFDRSQIMAVEFDLGPTGTSSNNVGVDDLRFE